MPSLDPAIAEVRRAVRAAITPLAAAPVVVGLSGGADSLALTAAAVFEAGKLGGRVIAAVVGGYALTTGLGSHPDSYTTSGMVWATVATLFGGVGATLAGWGINGRREAGLSGIAAIASWVSSWSSE